MSRQIDCLQRMVHTQSPTAKVLVVTSGKGGVGKTNISANLSLCLASSGKRILLFDADLSLGNMDVLMGTHSPYNIIHFIQGHKSLPEIIQTGPYGLEMICGASGFEELANLGNFQRQRLIHELSELQCDRDAIIIDTAAGISHSVIGFCLFSDHTLVVTTPEATAMTDAYAMIKVLASSHYKGRISLIVNMADTIAEGKRVYRQIANVARRFLNLDVYEGAILLRDDKVPLSVRHRKPVVLDFPKARITNRLAALAAQLGRNNSAESANPGFFRKVVDWFF